MSEKCMRQNLTYKWKKTLCKDPDERLYYAYQEFPVVWSMIIEGNDGRTASHQYICYEGLVTKTNPDELAELMLVQDRRSRDRSISLRKHYFKM